MPNYSKRLVITQAFYYFLLLLAGGTMYIRDEKLVGKISKEICDKYNIYEYEGLEIYQSLDLYLHIQKHIEEFKSIDNYEQTIFNLDVILNKPIHVSYNNKNNTFHYYGKINENVCCVVKVRINKGNCYVATVYPVSEKKINKAIEESYIRE